MKRLILQTILLLFTLTSIGQTHRLAILDICERSDEINKENLASAIHMAEVAGMPYIISTDVSESLTYPFVLVTSTLRDETFSTDETTQLINYVSEGGVLIAPFIKSEYYFELFGINYTKLESNRYWLKWNVEDNHPELKWINEEEEKELPLADLEYYRSIYTRGYTPEDATVLAHFEDNTAAITKHTYGLGTAYALGFELKDVVLRNLLNKDYNANRMYSNGFEPTTDMFLLFLREIYRANQSVAIHKHTSPGNSSSVILLTHDVDSNTGMDSMYYFSEWEANNGIKAHYFITTRYFSDALMSDFYREEHFPKMKNLLTNGHVIGSHSVGHFPDFANRTLFPIGEPGNTKESYQPAYHDGVTAGGMLTAELEVSRDLLIADIGANIRSFRAGHLAFNTRLINVMSDLGYAFNSTNSANDVLTNFPYRQRTNNAFSGTPTEVYEMPMTISDASKTLKLSEETMDEVVGSWIEVFNKNNDNGAPTILLIHPNRGWKLESLIRIMAQKPAKAIPFEFDAFGEYWLERRDLDFDYSLNENQLTIQLNNTEEISVEQSLVISNAQNVESIQILNANGEPIDFQSDVWGDNDLIISRIGTGEIVAEPKEYTLIIHSQDEYGVALNNVNWLVLNSDSTLIGEGNTGNNALDTLMFSNLNSSSNIIIKTTKEDYVDARMEQSILAEHETNLSTINEIVKYPYQFEVKAIDSETELELDSIHVQVYLNRILLKEEKSLETTKIQIELLYPAREIELEIRIERVGYQTGNPLFLQLNTDEISAIIGQLIKIEEPEIPEINNSRLALLNLCARNDESDEENLASTIQMADVAGIPYTITTNVDEALEMGFILITSPLKDATLTDIEIENLKTWVSQGGVLLAPYIYNSELFDLFGIEERVLDKYRYQLNWDESGRYNELKWIDDNKEKSLPLADPDYYKSIYTLGYTCNTAQVLAAFEDQTVAVSSNPYGLGKAYAFGVEWKDVILRNLLNKDYQAERSYSNDFEPTSDVFMLLLRAVFTENQSVSVYKHTSPGESSSALLITHDVDSRTIISTMNYFSNWEFVEGISTHYFVATHYFKDTYMSAYYEEPNFEKIHELLERNHTIGSHSVGHFPDFSKTSVFPEGEPGNTQLSYQPFYNGSYTEGGTVYGELEVSRDLLNADIGANVRSFRSGGLAFNTHIVNVMENLGYAFNSSMSANNVLTNFPYQQRTNKAFSGVPANVYEIPLTLTDVSSANKLVETNIDEVVALWADVIGKNNANHAPTSLLISPNREWKLQALQNLLQAIPESVITYNFEDFGDYWLDRKALDFEYVISGDSLTITLNTDVNPAEDLSLVIANGTVLNKVFIKNSLGQSVNFNLKSWTNTDLIITFGMPEQSMREKKTAKIDVPQLISESKLTLFPNPAKNFVNLLFDMEIEEDYNLSLIDVNGRLIQSKSGRAQKGSVMHRIDLEGINKGLYLVKFETNTYTETLKLTLID